MIRHATSSLVVSSLLAGTLALPNALSSDDPPLTVPLAPFHWELQAQQANIICSTPGNENATTFGSVTADGLEQAVKYLENLGSQPRMEAGPASCKRVSCSHWTAVFLCNDVSLRTGDRPPYSELTQARPKLLEH